MQDILHYLVARCKSSETITLAERLHELGLDAWSPSYQQRVRLPRVRKTRVDVRAAMPSFVFIAEADVERALDLSLKKAVPAMSLFKFNRIIARIRFDQLDHLRTMIEEKPDSSPLMNEGDKVVITAGHFIGFSGLVLGWDGNYHTVQLDHRGFHLKVPPFLLAKNQA
jgi:hypothetical protein